MTRPTRHTQRALLRTLTVLLFILESPRTLAEIAAHTEVTDRTTRRDLDVLQRAGLPIVDTCDMPNGEKRWACLPSRFVRRIALIYSAPTTHVRAGDQNARTV